MPLAYGPHDTTMKSADANPADTTRTPHSAHGSEEESYRRSRRGVSSPCGVLTRATQRWVWVWTDIPQPCGAGNSESYRHPYLGYFGSAQDTVSPDGEPHGSVGFRTEEVL